jgi:hypothetical protein
MPLFNVKEKTIYKIAEKEFGKSAQSIFSTPLHFSLLVGNSAK